MCHEFPEAAFGERALLEPDQVFLGKVEDRHAPGRIFVFPEHAVGHVGGVDFPEQVAEILAVDFGEVHVGVWE